jgi:hypothetical protein
METLVVILCIGTVLAVLASAGFRKKKESDTSLVDAESVLWEWPLPETMEGSIYTMTGGKNEGEEVDNVVLPELWFSRRKDTVFHEARKRLLGGGLVWWRPFEMAEHGAIRGRAYVETRVVGNMRLTSEKRLLYLETVDLTDEICRTAGFTFDRMDNGWRGYRVKW